MKTIQRCFLIFVFLLLSTIALGAPFLVSDPYPGKDTKLTKFLVTINGKNFDSMPVKNSQGSVYLKYDLGNLPNGTYTAVVKAVDAKGKQSSPASYSFKKTGTKVEPYVTPVPKQKIVPSKLYPGQVIR